MEFKDHSYCYYTDFNPVQTQKFSIPIITIQGNPPFTFEWQHLEKNSLTRWINYIFPGLDNEDERRGEIFSGTIDDHCLMLKNFMDSLNIEKAIFFVHSLGFLIFNIFLQKYPQKTAAYGLFGSLGLNFHSSISQKQLKLLEYTKKEFQNFNSKMLNDENVRKKFITEIKPIVFNHSKYEIRFLQWAKILLDQHLQDQNFYQNIKKSQSQYLKFLCQGNNDIIVNNDITLISFNHYIIENSYKNTLKLFQIQFMQRQYPQYSHFSKLNLQKLQENFVFYLNGGHNIHLTAGQSLLPAVYCFQAVVESLNFSQPKL